MPIETQQAVDWALTQTYTDPDFGTVYLITKDMTNMVVDKVREYFNKHSIEYNNFSYDELDPYLL